VVDPLDQEVYSQLSIANNADYIAGFGGAGLANIMGIRSRSKIFEILPPKFSSNWIRNFCATLGVDYFAHGVSEVSLKSADAVINEKLHKDFFTSYEIDIDDLNADLGVFLKDCA
jgi:capsular polysaccharide biosynthesis protein